MRAINNVVWIAGMLLLVKCYNRKKVKSLVELAIIVVVGSEGEEPPTN